MSRFKIVERIADIETAFIFSRVFRQPPRRNSLFAAAQTIICPADRIKIAIHSTILLGLEMFSGGDLRCFAIAAAVSYVLSGNFGLYSKQKLMYSKLRPEYINIYAHH